MDFYLLFTVLLILICSLCSVVENSSHDISFLPRFKRHLEHEGTTEDQEGADYEDEDDYEDGPETDIAEATDIDKLGFIMRLMINKITEMDSELKDLSKKIKYLKCNPVPLGFIYIEYGNQSHPSVLWPAVEWSDVTRDYAGLFFRAQGEKSGQFGQVQEQEVPRIYRVRSVPMTRGQKLFDVVIPTSSAGSNPNLFTGENNGASSWWALQLLVRGQEVRPTNQAIRIWKRVA